MLESKNVTHLRFRKNAIMQNSGCFKLFIIHHTIHKIITGNAIGVIMHLISTKLLK